MLNDDFLFNYRSIRSYTSYACEVDADTTEREASFHVALGPSTERRGDVFPVYEIPADRMAWVSDWSFNSGGPLNTALAIGGSLGRITRESQYVFVLNCSVSAGEMKIFSPARAIRYLPGEWISVCFHHMGAPLDTVIRATFRFVETPAPESPLPTRYFDWWAGGVKDLFLGPE